MGFAQESIYTASVSGRVTDPSGAVVAGAKVTATQTETNQSSEVQSDKEGRFRFPYMRLGPYEIVVQQQGFAEIKREVTLTVGSAFDLPISLEVAQTQSSVTVSTEPQLLEAARTQVAGTVGQAEIRNLPLNGRNFLDTALLIPGVSPTNTASTQLFPETSAVPGQGISVGSQRNFSNNFTVDGLSANDDAAGLSGVMYGVDAVNDFQVVTSGGQAEFGRALGGYVNVVTKSGTNTLHGDLYGYFRHDSMNAENSLSHSTLPLTQAQYGASLGGPIVQDRTFYFANFEQRRLQQSGLVTITPANAAAINTRLTAVGYQGPLLTTGLYPNPVHSTTLLGKVDHQLSPRDMFTVRYSLYDVTSENSRGVGALSAVTAAAGLDNTDNAISMANIFTISPRMLNETRGQFTYNDLKAEPNDTVGPSVSISGVATFGRLSGSPTARKNKMVQLVDNFSYMAGAHAVRVGADFLYNDTTITYPRQIYGSYSFSSLANFLSGVYNNSGFSQTFGNSMVSQTNPNIGMYAQDEWKLHPKLTLNAGLRYDLQWIRTIETDTNNVSPRVGLVWSPLQSRKTLVRGSWGLFYDRVPLRAVANALLSSENTTTITPTSQISVSLSPAQAGAPVFPNIIGALPSNILPSFSTMQRDMQNAYSTQTSVEFEQQLGRAITVSAGYQHLRGVHLIASINQNVPTCVASGSNNGCRPYPNYANNSQYRSAGDSKYDALFISYLQRLTRGSSFRVSYTFSKSNNNVGEFFFSQPINAYNIWEDWGRSDDDQRHRLVFYGSAQLKFGFQVSGMVQYYSALPFNITTGTSNIQGRPARPIVDSAYIPRNSGEGFDFVNMNLRLSHVTHIGDRLRMEAIAEAFNALNHTNGVTLNGTFGTGVYPTEPRSTFKQVTAVGDPRTMQLALRFGF